MTPIAAENVGRGLFVVDFYHSTYNDGPITDVAAMLAARDQGLIGAIPKCSDGGNGHRWFRDHAYSELRDAAGDRYGRDWYCGAYHFLRWDSSGGTGAHQADVYAWNHEHAKGWRGWDDSGAMLHMLDVEGVGSTDSNGDPTRNTNATHQQLVDHITGFTRRMHQLTGRGTIVYGRSFYAAVAPRVRWDELAGAHAVGGWNPAYTESEDGHELPMPRERQYLWQYTNGKTNRTPFPTRFRGVEHELDVSVFKGAKKGGGEMMRLDKFRQYVCGHDSPVLEHLKAAAVVGLGLGLAVVAR